MNTTNTTNTANTSAAASFVITKHYAKRDHEAQGDHYINHVSAMTGEGLHAKSDIAAELAHRDIEIDRLRATLAAPAQAGEYPPLVCDYCGALTPDPWHSSGMLYGKMSKHIHSCDACAARGAAQAAPVDAAVQQDAERLDFLQECGVTVEVLPGRPGWTFRIGGLHGTVHRSVRTAIDAARAAQEGKHD